MELTLDQALQKGIEAHKAGKAQEADRYYTAILKANPKHPDANHNMGVLAVGVGKVEISLPFFKVALDTNPNVAQYWASYIDTLIKLDRMVEAKAVLDQAKSNGVQVDAFDQIEKTLAGLENVTQAKAIFEKPQEPPKKQIQPLIDQYSQGQYQKALDKASQLQKQFPNSIILYNITGAANKSLGRLEEAITAYKKALYVKPDYAEAYYNMGVVLQEQGKLEEAIEAYTKALSIKPDYAEAYYNMGVALKGIIFTKLNRDLQKIVVSLLDKATYVRPADISKAAISLLKLEPILQKHLQIVDNDITGSPLGIISDLCELPLLLKLMSVCPLPDLEVEKLLQNLRRSILSNISSLKEASPKLLGVQSALALQCFTNEYIYNQSEHEREALAALEAIVQQTLSNGDQPSPQSILCLASYRPLHEYEWCSLLLITDGIEKVLTRQVLEPNEEEKLKQNLPILEEITDRISSEVRAQYEESPYPRWVNLGLPLKPLSIPEVVDGMKLILHSSKITEVEKPEILIAGCGTGQHSIETAARFKDSKILAIDLSLSSLMYAKRKTDGLGIDNIKHMQADILDLAKLNKQFDIIESAGVLHHMDNPAAGWKVLVDCLKPGGLMKIGLYSELARQHVVKIRNEINNADIGSSSADIRSFRNMILKSDKDHHTLIKKSTDFYSLSTLKDLLFHVQEHRFTIPQIHDYLNTLGLRFCGFETKDIVSQFQQINTEKEDLYDLNKWYAYEEANPEAFGGMYQFWCQKGT